MSVDEVKAKLLQCCEENKAILIEGTVINLDKAPIILLECAQFFEAVVAEITAVFFTDLAPVFRTPRAAHYADFLNLSQKEARLF